MSRTRGRHIASFGISVEFLWFNYSDSILKHNTREVVAKINYLH